MLMYGFTIGSREKYDEMFKMRMPDVLRNHQEHCNIKFVAGAYLFKSVQNLKEYMRQTNAEEYAVWLVDVDPETDLQKNERIPNCYELTRATPIYMFDNCPLCNDEGYVTYTDAKGRKTTTLCPACLH